MGYFVVQKNKHIKMQIKKGIKEMEAKKIITIEDIRVLDDTETWFYKSGRNARNTHHSHSAEAVEYRRATGLECLYGYFYLSGNQQRAKELFLIAAKQQEQEEV